MTNADKEQDDNDDVDGDEFIITMMAVVKLLIIHNMELQKLERLFNPTYLYSACLRFLNPNKKRKCLLVISSTLVI